MEPNINPTEDEKEETEDWRNEHGLPDADYLHSLASHGQPEDLEKLQSFAEDLDIDYDPDMSKDDLIDKIRYAEDQNTDVDPMMTN